jgi:hypothetical protein
MKSLLVGKQHTDGKGARGHGHGEPIPCYAGDFGAESRNLSFRIVGLIFISFIVCPCMLRGIGGAVVEDILC